MDYLYSAGVALQELSFRDKNNITVKSDYNFYIRLYRMLYRKGKYKLAKEVETKMKYLKEEWI